MHTYSICFQLFPFKRRLIADKTASFKVLQLRFACPVTLSNIMHELFSIVAVPAVAQRIGYIEAVALPGATAMDTVLPVVVSATSDRMAL